MMASRGISFASIDFNDSGAVGDFGDLDGFGDFFAGAFGRVVSGAMISFATIFLRFLKTGLPVSTFLTEGGAWIDRKSVV